MSSNSIVSPDLPELPQAMPALTALRAEIDRLDDEMHALLRRRATVVAEVAALRESGKIPFRPGREAAILRRLLARHDGPLDPRLLVRMWRELFAATTAMQAPYLVAVCETGSGAEFVQCAREHFGALTPLRAHRSPAQAIGQVSSGQAVAAVLPMPAEEDAAATAWWTALLHRDSPRIHIVARLPFWAPRAEGAPGVQALVVAASPPDPSGPPGSGADRSLIGLELPLEMSRARLSAALVAAGLAPGATILRRDHGAPVAHALVEVADYVDDDDPRLVALPGLLRPPVVLGAYAVPLAKASYQDGGNP